MYIILFCIIFGIAFFCYGVKNNRGAHGNIPTVIGVFLCIVALTGIAFPESLAAIASSATPLPTTTPAPVESIPTESAESTVSEFATTTKDTTRINVAYFESFDCNTMAVTENWFNSTYSFYTMQEDGGLKRMTLRTANVTLYPTLEAGEQPYLEIIGKTFNVGYRLYYDKNIKR